MSTQLTLEGFFAFINTQPADLEINHLMWHTCAVGDYSRAITGDPNNYTQLLHDMELHEPELYCLLNETGWDSTGFNHIGTYGDLQEFIKDLDTKPAE